MVDNIKEKNNESYPEPVTLKATEKIIDQRIMQYVEYIIKIKMVTDFF